MSGRRPSGSSLLIAGVLLLGLVLRGLASLAGYNYDFTSYRIVVEILEQGELVYNATWRYNYGPIWFHVLRSLDLAAGLLPFEREAAFRGLLIALLSFADVAIAAMLYRRVGPLAAAIFFLNPVSIFITGYHNQFDNLALCVGFTAVQLFERGDPQRLDRLKLVALAILGLSLMTKHLLFAFPLWLAVRQRGWGQRAAVLGLPVLIFLAGFAPYWAEGHAGIMLQVFQYKSGNNGPLYALPPLAAIEPLIPRQVFWYGGLVAAGLLLRRVGLLDAALLYSGLLVALAPAMTNQYLAIPMALIAARLNPAFGIYVVIAAWHLLVDVNGFQLTPPVLLAGIDRQVYYGFALVALWGGLIWILARNRLASGSEEQQATPGRPEPGEKRKLWSKN